MDVVGGVLRGAACSGVDDCLSGSACWSGSSWLAGGWTLPCLSHAALRALVLPCGIALLPTVSTGLPWAVIMLSITVPLVSNISSISASVKVAITALVWWVEERTEILVACPDLWVPLFYPYFFLISWVPNVLLADRVVRVLLWTGEIVRLGTGGRVGGGSCWPCRAELGVGECGRVLSGGFGMAL